MDPSTVVIVLAIHLICTGGLFHLIHRRLPPDSGVGDWGGGSIVFGLAYLVRLMAGPAHGPWVALLVDTAMVCAAMLFLGGLLRWLGAWPTGMRAWALLVGVALYAAAFWLSWWAGGMTGRFLLLNLGLALAYLLIGGVAWRGARRLAAGPARQPLWLLAGLVGGLGVLTGLHGLYILPAGTGPLFAGWTAQVYYAYSSLAMVLVALSLLWMVFVRLNDRLRAIATHDALTGLLDRNGLDDVLERHFAARHVSPLVFLALDVDHFKRINDVFGHATGDRVLCEIAQVLAGRLRGADFLARVGGEEFLVGCVAHDIGMATALAERLREGVAAMRLTAGPDRQALPCTVSVGVSQVFSGRAQREQAMREADAALYMAKSGGRNRVAVYGPVAPAGALA